MQRVSIRENKLRVDLDWGDVTMLTHVIEYAKDHDVMGTAAAWGMAIGYLEATLPFLQAAGRAPWAQTVREQTCTLARCLRMPPITREERRQAAERQRAWQREQAARRGPTAQPTPPAA